MFAESTTLKLSFIAPNQSAHECKVSLTTLRLINHACSRKVLYYAHLIFSSDSLFLLLNSCFLSSPLIYTIWWQEMFSDDIKIGRAYDIAVRFGCVFFSFTFCCLHRSFRKSHRLLHSKMQRHPEIMQDRLLKQLTVTNIFACASI